MKVAELKSPSLRGRPPTEKQIVIDAAIRCFEKNGSQRTSMTDIAKEADVSRKTVYRLFADRSKLIERVLFARFAGMRDKIAEKVDPIEDTWEAITEGVLVSVKVAQEDRLINEIVRKDTDYQIEKLIIRANGMMLRYMLEYWGPIFDRGRKSGLIRPALSDERIFELLMSFFAVLLLRDDSDEALQRRFLEDLFEGVFAR